MNIIQLTTNDSQYIREAAELLRLAFPDSYSDCAEEEVIKSYMPYISAELEKGTSVHSLIAPLQSLFHGQKGSKVYRQLLSSSSIQKDTIIDILHTVLKEMPTSILWETKNL